MALRLGGKRQLAQLYSFDMVVLLLSNTVQNAIIGMRTAVPPGAIALGNRGHPPVIWGRVFGESLHFEAERGSP